ncbi:MAG: ribosome biogenesis GTPase Der [Rhodospirillales bacterium]
MLPHVAIVGRPNVGKSTLFNRLTGRRSALVDNSPGVTRDRREGEAQLYDLTFMAVDTAGLEEAPPESLAGRMRAQSERAVGEAAVVLFVIDARSGLVPADERFAGWLRRLDRPVILVANKCEGRLAEVAAAEAYRLGLGEPLAFSAEHGLGMGDLHEALKAHIVPVAEAKPAAESPNDPERDAEEVIAEREAELLRTTPLQMVVIGRPNVGKSTLINRLIGEDRLLTGPEAGITRDSIALDWQHRGQAIQLIDTAGLRRRAKIKDGLERLAGADTRRALRYAHIAVLLLDGTQPLERQDLTIAESVIEEGRGLLLAVNKWDLVEDPNQTLADLKRRVEHSLPRARGLPIVTLSAITGRGLKRLLPAVVSLYEAWNRRIPTAQLNRFLEVAVAEHPPPAPQGRRIRLKYMTQAKSRPPTFALFGNQAEALPESYLRYLENSLRERFDLFGPPLRLRLRGSRNPYTDRR